MKSFYFCPALILIGCLNLTGCAGTFNSAVSNLPSVKDCQHVNYERTGNIVRIEADCAIPIQNSALLNVPVVP